MQLQSLNWLNIVQINLFLRCQITVVMVVDVGWMGVECKCDWILENRSNCHTRPFLFYWPSYVMATLVHYTYTVPLPGLVDWPSFLEQVCQPCNFTTETMEPKAWV